MPGKYVWDNCANKSFWGACMGGLKYVEDAVPPPPPPPIIVPAVVLPPSDVISDLSTRQASLSRVRESIGLMARTYQNLLSNYAHNNTERTELNSQIQSLRGELHDLEHAAETYEKEFLDRKQTLPTSSSTFRTLQDIILALFFIGLIIISLMTIASGGGFTQSVMISIIVVMIGALSVELIRLYG